MVFHRRPHYSIVNTNAFDLELHLESECIFLGNASERKETGTYTCGSFANEFWIEKFVKDSFRFHCNDHEPDDDFDDMIFEITITDSSL